MADPQKNEQKSPKPGSSRPDTSKKCNNEGKPQHSSPKHGSDELRTSPVGSTSGPTSSTQKEYSVEGLCPTLSLDETKKLLSKEFWKINLGSLKLESLPVVNDEILMDPNTSKKMCYSVLEQRTDQIRKIYEKFIEEKLKEQQRELEKLVEQFGKFSPRDGEASDDEQDDK